MINLIQFREFFAQTRPKYFIHECYFGENRCKGDWKRIGTLMGDCLKLDPNHYRPHNQTRTVGIMMHR